MWLFRFRKGDATKVQQHGPAGLIFEGRCTYAGGHPEHPEPYDGHVYVTDEGISFRKGIGKTVHVFTIPARSVQGVHQTQTAPAGELSSPDQFVTIDMAYRNRTFEVRFKAMGYRRQRTAFAFYGAVNTLIGRQLVE